jgi:hypothetical protein
MLPSVIGLFHKMYWGLTPKAAATVSIVSPDWIVYVTEIG